MVPSPRCEHVARQHFTRAEEGPLQIRVVDAIPRRRLRGPHGRRQADTGVVDEDVDAPVRAQRSLDHGRDLILTAGIGLDRHHAAAIPRRELTRHLRQGVAAPVDADDVHPALSELTEQHLSETAPGARHDRDLAGQIDRHVQTPRQPAWVIRYKLPGWCSSAHPGGTTIVVVTSSTMAGPAIVAPHSTVRPSWIGSAENPCPAR